MSDAPCTIGYDVDGDGDADGVSMTTWDNGQREVEVQYDPIGRVTIAERYFYEGRNRIRTEVDIGNDGTVDEINGTTTTKVALSFATGTSTTPTVRAMSGSNSSAPPMARAT